MINATKARTVHVVDDDDLTREAIADLVSTLPDVVVQSWSSAEAFLDEIRIGAEPGVVLLDLRMPGLSGTEALSEINRKLFPTIMVSGYGQITSAVEALKRGAIDFLEKPFTLEKLLPALKIAFEQLDQNLRDLNRVENDRSRLNALSDREREILTFLVTGLTNREAADRLGLSVRTVESHRARIMLKLNVTSFAEAIRLALHAGVTPKH